MTKKPILDELHSVRERLLADAGGTLGALVDRLQAEEQQSNRPRYKSRRTFEGLDSAVNEGSDVLGEMVDERDGLSAEL